MNAALDSPLEALAVNYLTYGFLTAVNNIWAWIAFITAAVSVWRVRALTSSSPEPTGSRETFAVPPLVPEEEAVAPAKAPCRVLEREGSTKMKFSVYYGEERKEEDCRGDFDGGESEDCGGCIGAAPRKDTWRGDWDEFVVMRMGDNMGWYRWQDRTVLDGSVVRLWEGRKRIHAAAQVAGGAVSW